MSGRAVLIRAARSAGGANADIVVLTVELAVESTFVQGRDERGWA